MPPPKPVGRRIVDKLKKAKGVAVSSKQKLGKRNTPTEFKKPHSSDTSAELIQCRPSGTPGPKKHWQLGTPGHPKLQPSGTPTGLTKHHPSALKNIQLSVSLTKLSKPQLPSSPTESKDPYLSILTELEKSGPLEIPDRFKKRGPGRPRTSGINVPENIEQKGKKRKAVEFSPAHTVKRVKFKHDNLYVSSTTKKDQKHNSSFKTSQLNDKKITRPGSHAAKGKSKVSKTEPIPGLEFGSTLQETLAHLPLLKAKSPKSKSKTVAQKTVPVSTPVIKTVQIKKKTVQFPHSKAAIKRAQQILSQKSKSKTALVSNKKIKKRDQAVDDKQPPQSKTPVKRTKQILSQKSKMNKTASTSRKKVRKQSPTFVESESHDNEVKVFKPVGSLASYKINIPVGLEPFSNKQFWQPSVILKKLEDIVLLGIKKSSKEPDTVSTEDIELANGSQIPVNVAGEETPNENCEPIVQHPNSKDNLISSKTVNHSSKNKLHVITDPCRGKSKKSVDEKEVAEQVPQSVSKEEGEANKIVTVEETPIHPNQDPPKGTKVQRRRSLASGDSAVEEPQVQNGTVIQKVKSRSKLLDSTSEELEKQKQVVMKKPQSRTFLLKETDDMNSNESVPKTVGIAVPEETKTANKDSLLMVQQSETENKEISCVDKTSKRRTKRNSDKMLIPPASKDIRNEIAKASNVDSQSDGIPKRKRRHSDQVRIAPVKRTRLQLKDMAEHEESFNTEKTSVDGTERVKITAITKKKEENLKTVAPVKKTKEAFKDKTKQTQNIQIEVKMSHVQAEGQKSGETARTSKSVTNIAREQIKESNSSQKQVMVGSNISLDSVESPETDMDSDVSSCLVTKESNLLNESQEDPNISDQLRLLDPSFIEEANLSELLNSDSSCDNMSWNSLNVIANQRKAEKLLKDFFILHKNLAILKEAKAKRDELYKDIVKQMKDYVIKQVTSVRSEKI